jgi:hypothetical protein
MVAIGLWYSDSRAPALLATSSKAPSHAEHGNPGRAAHLGESRVHLGTDVVLAEVELLNAVRLPAGIRQEARPAVRDAVLPHVEPL